MSTGVAPARHEQVPGARAFHDGRGDVIAEGVGFEPTNGTGPSPVFKTGAIGRSATSPNRAESASYSLDSVVSSGFERCRGVRVRAGVVALN